MAQPPTPLQHHCKDCGLFFDSGKSLDVHLQYHKENLLSKWGNSSGEESNNNNVKPSKPQRVAAVPADSSDSVMDRFSPSFNFPVNRSTPPSSYYSSTDMRPPSVGQDGGSRPNSNFNPNAEPDYILGSGSGFPQRRSPTPTSPSPLMLQTSSSFRFHPYQQSVYTHQDQRNGGVSSSSPGLIPNHQNSHQCEKCGYACDSPTILLEHIQSSHPPSQPENFGFSNDFMRQHIKNEPQAEILDLDSHKVHVYQPPQGEESSQSSQIDPGMVPWMNSMQEKKLYHPMNMNGSGMPSPDFNVSTTTLNSPEIPHHQSYHYEHHINSPNQLPPQITSSQLPPLTPKTGLQSIHKSQSSSNNSSWKSNEARRPKTYNCTACNKWFTSSGHLKRHYNTTLHKNAVKQSGIPDPANVPVSNHHHPPKDPAPPFISHQDSSPTSQMEENQMMPIKLEDGGYDRPQLQLGNGNNFLSNPPNSMAGPSEVTGGLLLHSTPFQTSSEEMRSVQHTLPHMQQHQNFLPFSGAPHPTYPQGMTMYPNLQPPHVSSIRQTVTSNTTGNLDVLEQNDLQQIWGRNGELKNQLISLAKLSDQEPLPSFSHFAQNFGGIVPAYQSYSSTVERQTMSTSTSDSNVGGLSPSQVSSLVETFYSPCSPNSNFQIANVNTIEEDKFIPGSDGNTLPLPEHSTFEGPYPSDMLPTSTEDDHKKPVIVEHVKIEDSSVSSTITERNTPSPIRCVDCDKVFNKACYLTQHNKSFHTGDKPFKCEKCGKRFETETHLLDHMSKHAGEKPYKCEICPKQFNHKTDLRRHLCLHSGEKPFCCNICGKGFIRKDHMIKHCDTHKRKHAIPPTMKVLFSHKNISDIELPPSLKVNH